MTPAERITQNEREKLATLMRIKVRGFLNAAQLDEDVAVLTARVLCTHPHPGAWSHGRYLCPDCGGNSR